MTPRTSKSYVHELEKDVQEILGSALREFGVFEQTVRDVLGVPKP